MKFGIKFSLRQLTHCRPADLPVAIDMVKMHMDAAMRALERHTTIKDYSVEELDDHVAEIRLDDNAMSIKIRPEVPEDKKHLPYTTEITFPSSVMRAREIAKEADNASNS